ncbi:uncharacterized protein BN629_01283 [Eggerthella sp. CAG:368]|nr:uncharacterized protein BN629_01283 [Eggerthella sp. CAG:368]
MIFCIFNHTINFVIGKSSRTRNGDLLLLASAKVLSGNVDDTVCVNVKGNLNLRNTTTCCRNTCELELTKRLVASSHLALALKNVNLNRSLIIGCSRVNLGLAGRNGGVALDHLSHNAAHGFNTQGEWSYVKKKNAFDVTSKNAALNSSTHCNYLIRIYGHIRLLTGHVLYQILNSWHTS